MKNVGFPQSESLTQIWHSRPFRYTVSERKICEKLSIFNILLDRALDYESRGREFESSRARHFPSNVYRQLTDWGNSLFLETSVLTQIWQITWDQISGMTCLLKLLWKRTATFPINREKFMPRIIPNQWEMANQAPLVLKKESGVIRALTQWQNLCRKSSVTVFDCSYRKQSYYPLWNPSDFILIRTHTRTVKAHWSAIGRCLIYKSHIHFLGEHHIKDSNSAGAIFGQSPDGDDLLVNS